MKSPPPHFIMILEALHEEVNDRVKYSINSIIQDIMDALSTPVEQLTDDVKRKYEIYLKDRDKYMKKLKKIKKLEHEKEGIQNSTIGYQWEYWKDLYKIDRKIMWIKRFMITPIMTPEIEEYMRKEGWGNGIYL